MWHYIIEIYSLHMKGDTYTVMIHALIEALEVYCTLSR